MAHRTLWTLSLIGALGACTAEDAAPEPTSGLEIARIDDSAIVGSFSHAGSLVEFRSEAAGEQRATLHLDVNGAQIDVALDLGARTWSHDGYLASLFADDVAALAALRDALVAEVPDIVDTLHGTLLARHVDRLAEAPVGITLDKRVVDMTTIAPKEKVAGADADGCGEDGATCLPGTNGWDYAVYDQYGDGTCHWTWAPYGEDTSGCVGRCGEGCNHWFDDDYTWDCFDHDRCIVHYGGSTTTGNSNCTDEFWEADDDYIVTYGAWC